jgi:hypothetical protein
VAVEESISILKGFMTKPVAQRLGCGPNGENDIKQHPFFHSDRLGEAGAERNQAAVQAQVRVEEGRVQLSTLDFTNEKPALTPSDREAIESIDQSEFQGFSFINPDFASIV